MSDNSAAIPGHTEENSGIAQQWIEDLQKRNKVLNLVWPVMLVLVALLASASLFFYSQFSSLEESNELKTEMIARMEGELVSSNERLESLQAELSTLAAINEEFKEQSALTAEALQQRDELIDGLKLQLAEAEKIGLEMNQSFLLAKKELANISESSVSQLETLNSQYIKLKSDLSKKLSDSKTAYKALVRRQKETRKEVDRLAGLVDSKNAELGKLKKERQSLQSKLQSRQGELAKLKVDYKALEKKMSLAVAPISSSPPGGKDNTARSNTSDSAVTNAAKNINTDLAFQPIKVQPKVIEPPKKLTSEDASKKKSEASSASFDFDTIAVD